MQAGLAAQGHTQLRRGTAGFEARGLDSGARMFVHPCGSRPLWLPVHSHVSATCTGTCVCFSGWWAVVSISVRFIHSPAYVRSHKQVPSAFSCFFFPFSFFFWPKVPWEKYTYILIYFIYI